MPLPAPVAPAFIIRPLGTGRKMNTQRWCQRSSANRVLGQTNKQTKNQEHQELMEELEGVHETLNACGLVLRWRGPPPSCPCQAGLWFSRMKDADWSIGDSAKRLEGRAGHTLSRMVPPPALSVLLSFDPGAQNEDPRDLRQRMRSSW